MFIELIYNIITVFVNKNFMVVTRKILFYYKKICVIISKNMMGDTNVKIKIKIPNG